MHTPPAVGCRGVRAYGAVRQRFSPVMEASLTGGEDVIVVFSNRVGNEINEVRELTTKKGQVIPLGESVSYAGSSCAVRFSGGKVSILDMMGKGEEGLLVFDTEDVSLPSFVCEGSLTEC